MRCLVVPIVLLLALFAFTGQASASDPVRYALCDVRVVYLFDDPGSIDWPTLYYLNDTYGCRIDLVTARERSRTDIVTTEVPGRELYLNTVYMSETDSSAVSEALSDLFSERLPDIVLHADIAHDRRLALLYAGIALALAVVVFFCMFGLRVDWRIFP